MKGKMAALMLCLASICSFGQEVKIISDVFPQYQGVVIINGKSSSELYNSLKLWVAENYNSANDVIQLDDKENGILIIKGYIPVAIKIMTGMYTFDVRTNFKFETKDGKFRYTADVTNILDPNAPTAGDMMNSIQKKPDGKYQMGAKDSITNAINEIIQSLAKKLTNETTTEDW